jgi:ribonuclease III
MGEITTNSSSPTSAVGNSDERSMYRPPQDVDKTRLERVLGFNIVDISKYVPAFTHKSVLRDLPDGCESYERLEMLGDSLIGFVVAKYLYDMFRGENEGFLTRVRTRLVCSKTLAEISAKLGLDQFIRMNRRSMANNFHKNARMLEDVFEALCASIYLDLGMTCLREFILRELHPFIKEAIVDNNYKDALMKLAQSEGLVLVYDVIEDPQTSRATNEFQVMVVYGGWTGFGKHRVKREAEQRAAYEVLHIMGRLTPEQRHPDAK